MIKNFNLISYAAFFLAISVFILIVALSVFKIVDFDTMHKLASGRLIFESGIVRDCPFNYTKEDCQPMFMVQWLFHFLAFTIYYIAGWDGLVLTQSLIIISLFLIIFIYNIQSGASLTSSSVILLASVLVAMERFMLRADLLAILLAVLFFIVLKNYQNNNKNYLLAGLILIQISWANIHGSFPIAFFIILSFLAPNILEKLWQIIYLKKQVSVFDKNTKKIAILFLILVLVSFINPYGYHSFIGVFSFLIGYGPILRNIKEFMPTFQPTNFEYLTVKVFKILFSATLLITAFNFKKIKLRDLFLLIGFLYLAITSIRNIALFAVFAALILPAYLDNIFLFIKNKTENKKLWPVFYKNALLLIMIIFIIYTNWMTYQTVTNRFYYQEQLLRRFGFGVSEITYPHNAANFIKQSNISGNMFNNFSLGGFLHWKLFPERKTFIDNHTWTKEWYSYYLQIINGSVPINDVIDRYDINYFILTHFTEDTHLLSRALYSDPHWILVYFDEVAVIFIKAKPDNMDIISRFAINLEEKEYNPDTLTLKNPANFSWGYASRGIFLANKGLIDQALYQYKKAVEVNPRNYSAYNNMGLANYNLENYLIAEEAYLSSLKIRPDFAHTNYNLAMLYHKIGREDDALKKYKKTLKINPNYRLANYHVGGIYEKKENFSKAGTYYERELRINPGFTAAENALTRIKSKRFPGRQDASLESTDALIKRIENDPDNPDLNFRLGVAYGLEENHDMAFEQFKKTVELDPDHTLARFNLANIYSMKGMHENAKNEYLAVIEVDPDFAGAYLNLGVFYRYYEKNNEKALENWQKFLELAPDDPQANNVKQEIAIIVREEIN